MEESIWLYFGIILVLVALGIIVTVYKSSQDEGTQTALFQSIGNMGSQASIICKSPRDTMLSIKILVPAGSLIKTTSTKICGTFANETRCVPADCALEEQTILNLTDPSLERLFTTRPYTCSFLKQENVTIACQG